jgi:predicted transcriptional regulator
MSRQHDAKLQVLSVLESFGPMPLHALAFKSALPERRVSFALRQLHYGALVEPAPGGAGLWRITAAGRRWQRP